MGLPFPPPWQSGAACAICEAVLFDDDTPKFVYAFVQDLIVCPGVLPVPPDPNGVYRMTQVAGQPCVWFCEVDHGLFKYNYAYYLLFASSVMVIAEIAGPVLFSHTIAQICKDSFVNQLVCGPPTFPWFFGGTVDCFW